MPKWSLSSDFSLIHNPSSVWSYGLKPAGYQYSLHPGCDGRFSVARFTAPKDGNYVISATFAHISSCAEHSGAYIVYNNLMTLWEVDLASPSDSKSFKTTNSGITVRANEPIDFIVGVGLDNTCHCDMTSAHVDIQLLDTLENQP